MACRDSVDQTIRKCIFIFVCRLSKQSPTYIQILPLESSANVSVKTLEQVFQMHHFLTENRARFLPTTTSSLANEKVHIYNVKWEKVFILNMLWYGTLTDAMSSLDSQSVPSNPFRALIKGKIFIYSHRNAVCLLTNESITPEFRLPAKQRKRIHRYYNAVYFQNKHEIRTFLFAF